MSSRKLGVSIAGLNVRLEIDTSEGYKLLEKWLLKYKENKNPDFTVHFFPDEKLFKFGFDEDIAENSGEILKMHVGMGHIDCKNKYAMGPDATVINREFAQYIFNNFLRMTVQYVLPSFCGVLIHASAVADEGKSFIFIAPNDGGKTTIAKKTGRFILSDDCIGIRRIDGHWKACATPWGSICNHGLYKVSGIFFISKSESLKLSRISQLSAVKKLFSNVCASFPTSRHKPSQIFENILSVVEQVCGDVPAYNLWFRREDNVMDEIKRRT